MSALRFAAVGPLTSLDATARRALFDRNTTTDDAVRERTRTVLARVRAEGDAALLAYAREFDGATLDRLEVPRDAWEAALTSLDATLRRALERAAANIRRVHEAFRPEPREVATPDGAIIGRRPDPLARVGVYAPGGRATYPSSLLMGAVPARVAGVREVIVCSPPDARGAPSAVLLAAAAIAGVDRVFAVGGAGAVAAMAYGTASIPAVDRIVGPGNAYVAEAKLQVSGRVGIDSPAGPSELLVLADASATPAVVAREMLAQAEHDPVAAVVLVTDSDALATEVRRELESRVDAEPRADVIRAAFAARGGILTVESLVDAVEFANAWAAEHLLLAVAPAVEGRVLAELRGAGTVFIGETASVAFGDYMSGANHVLPTGGLARIWSGLSTLDFVRWTTWQRIDREAARRLADDVDTFARAEGLPAHAAAARQWGGA
ncbi:histidinol dehydrogenase [Pseudogemmatithrix spongiicola]|uniref:Histidinol dehydrogenase n=1 Tax=Pseudogemmatithrix spongiicola TaxID=3062599 RepID=A0AA49Q427_9BACT|nr:histidinol dehydrogenase [Gemmatimonadaceae bacterium 'strain 138']WKW13724.1 histidinol dehydrogenase [Gemmatimonadaceae bacterium 'strain 318']